MWETLTHCRVLLAFDINGNDKKEFPIDGLDDMPAMRGYTIAYWSRDSEGALKVVNFVVEGSQVTKTSRLGPLLIHPNLNVIIGFGHFPETSRSIGLRPEISMYDYRHRGHLVKLPSSEHERVFSAFSYSWYRVSAFQDISPFLKARFYT